MKKLALFEFFRSTVKNMLIALFLAALCLLITVMYSVVSYEYGKIAPFKNLNISEGYFLGITFIEETEEQESGKMNAENFEGVEAVYQISACSFFNAEISISAYVYDEWVWKNWRGRLKSGSWFTESGAKSDEIEIIIGGDTAGYSVGDRIKVFGNNEDITLRIIGILQDNTEILYKDGYNYYEMNYQGMYTVPTVNEGEIFALAQSEAVERAELSLYNPCMWEIWKYSDSLSDEEAEALTREIHTKIQGAGKIYSTFLEKSEKLATQKVMTYVPTIAVSFLLMLAALYCIAYVNVQTGSRYYSIYYLTGASKRQCNIIALSYMVITIIMSVIMFIILGIGFETYARNNNIMYSFVTGPKLLAAGLYLVFALFLSLCLYMAMRKRSPLELLRTRKR